MDTQIQVVEQKNTGAIGQQMDSILFIAELLEKGKRNTGQLIEATGLSRPTVIKYRNEALKLLHNENKSLNTEALRNMEIGRLNYWIDWVQEKINELGKDEKDRDYRIKLLGRLDNFQGRLHSITGLNTTVNVNYEEKKRITFVMNAGGKPAGTTPLKAEPIEGELADSSTPKPQSPQ